MANKFDPILGEYRQADTSGGGSGDMTKAVYDPNSKNADAFSMGNMVETTTAKILTSAERTNLGNQSGTNTGDNATNSQYSGLATSKENTGVAAGLDATHAALTTGVHGAGVNSLVYSNDAKLTDARTPTTHDSTKHSVTYALPTDISTHAGLSTGVHGSGANSLIYSNDSRLTDNRTPSAHNQAESTITFTNTTTGNASTSSHGFFPILPTATGKFLKDDLTWSTIAGGGDVLAPATNTASYIPQWAGANSKTLVDGLAVPGGGLAGITALNLKAPIDAPTFTGIPAAPTATAGTNTTQLATTAFVTAINNNAQYQTIKDGAGSHIAAKVAGSYVFPLAGGVMAVSGTGTLYPQQVFYLTGADYPTINGITTKLRIKGSVFCNDVAPTGNFVFGLHPITRPATSGGAGLCIYTVGTVVSGSTATVTTPAADSSTNAIGTDFAIPADGWYALVCVTSATIATSAHTHLVCELQMRNA